MRFLLAGALVYSVSAQYTNVGCPDVTGDGTVNVEDLLQLLSGYAKDASGDVTGDGVTNVEVRALGFCLVCCVLLLVLVLGRVPELLDCRLLVYLDVLALLVLVLLLVALPPVSG